MMMKRGGWPREEEKSLLWGGKLQRIVVRYRVLSLQALTSGAREGDDDAACSRVWGVILRLGRELLDLKKKCDRERVHTFLCTEFRFY
jgi:hypothetical protein